MTTEARKGIIAFSITDRGALYASYMQFVENGGVFVPTTRSYELGDKVFLLLQLMDNTSPMALNGSVAWITPAGAQGNKTTGVGICFDEDSKKGKLVIEEHLAAQLSSGRPTNTM